MRFEHPHLLWLLLVIPPALALLFWWSGRVRQRLLTQFVEARLLSALTAGLSPARRKFRLGLFIAAVSLLMLAVARPQYGFDMEEVHQTGLDVVVAVDTSKSMLATDIAPNRLARAKLASLELMQKGADRMGLVAFAGNAFLSCPLTIDNTAFQQCLQSLDVKTIPLGGTALGEAIKTAQEAFKEGTQHKVLVIFSDGEDNDEGALESAQAAAKAGLKIFTIGVGSAEGTLVTIADAKGNTDYVRDEKGQVLKSKLNESLLQQIADVTGGFYLPLRGADTMSVLYERGLAPLPKTEGKDRTIRRYHEQFHWPLSAAILLLLAEILLPERKKTKVQSPPNRTAAGATLVIAALLPIAAHATPQTAMKDYHSGNFTNALQEFQRLAEIHTNDLRLVFNAGAAAYRGTNFDLAQKLFQDVTLATDLKLQQKAYYNLGNAQYRIASEKEDLDVLQKGFETAAATYERAVSLNTNDVDAAFNLKFVKDQIAQIAQLREYIKLMKTNADAEVLQRNYRRALDIMEPLKQFPGVAKQFEEFTTKLKNIDEILSPPAPTP